MIYKTFLLAFVATTLSHRIGNAVNNEEDKLSKLAEIVEDADSLANFKSPSSNSWKVFNSSLVIEEQSFNDMEIYLTSITRMYPDITSLYSIGKSTEGRDLWVMEISDNPGSHEPGEPEFHYVANIHGNERVGRLLTLQLIQFLCENYRRNRWIGLLVNETRIHLLPSANPDGYMKAYTYKKSLSGEGEEEFDYDLQQAYGRRNANNIDLNRNFPTADSKRKLELETKALIEWLKLYPFVLGADLHGGNLVADYPYDSSTGGEYSYHATPDDDNFRWLAEAYTLAHPRMHNGHPCPSKYGVFYKDGILNGAEYYNVKGMMLDWIYNHTNCLTIAVELDCKKYPDIEDISSLWLENRLPLLIFMSQIHKGIFGFVRDADGRGLSETIIKVQGINHQMISAKSGDYWTLLTPGVYTITFQKNGYETHVEEITIQEGAAVQLNVSLLVRDPFYSNTLIGGAITCVILVVFAIAALYTFHSRSCRNNNQRLVSLIELPLQSKKWTFWRCPPGTCCPQKRRDISLSDYSAAVQLLTIETDDSEEDEFTYPVESLSNSATEADAGLSS